MAKPFSKQLRWGKWEGTTRHLYRCGEAVGKVWRIPRSRDKWAFSHRYGRDTHLNGEKITGPDAACRGLVDFVRSELRSHGQV